VNKDKSSAVKAINLNLNNKSDDQQLVNETFQAKVRDGKGRIMVKKSVINIIKNLGNNLNLA
jgi:hypothetical protein